MVRPTLQLHPPYTAPAARPAATLLLLRDAPGGPEVLMTRRSPAASFLPGAFVFPGGRVDTADHEAHDLASTRPGQAAEPLTHALAALRESFEELGILLALRADGTPLDASDLARLDRTRPLYPQVRALGLRLAAAELRLLAHWVTDRSIPKRFDTTFLLARMPEGQQAVADDAEQFEPLWLRAADALERHAADRLPMIFPTLRWLTQFTNVDAVLAACTEDQPRWVSCPRAGYVGGQVQRYMEHDPPYGELALVCPDGQLEHALDWQHERPVPLLRHLHRLTAPNANVMTGPGTNSYIVGTAASGYIVIDPGPLLKDHIDRLLAFTAGRITTIVCTHSHPDHSPAAPPLAQACARLTGHTPPVLGLASAATARAHSHFTPDRALGDGERLTLRDGVHPITLRVVHTPGHAANHLCLILEEDGLLFSGDHILNGSTTIIDPPDGDMSAYLDPLDRLALACEQDRIEFILPAHGHVIGEAAQAIARLKAHRLRREAKVLAAMRAFPQGGPDEWLSFAYNDTPQALWPLARRSLLAHVQRIEQMAML
ncbi:MBL fold metallo-hydrolase [Noviherbaspirillum suwonense]|uniref:Glyoxylase, beta-lactamase superfamily II n=1 Tax=Noviherbaspirillum suwonense TaxID=1224511 RepID=A0ABY1QSH0_9BURK|nr:MBL fold metallo-hydrolase [Noviherbaspirillum suwonense]SMP79151.1 Glyoxylase, beta-lactamase superfamily II [Noviherbaspirillum suwonense]